MGKGVNQMNYDKIKNEFTAYMKLVIQHASIDYKRKVIRTMQQETAIEDFINVNVPKELLSCDDNSFLFEKGITYMNIESLFTNEKYYRAMKKLTDREKLVLYLSVEVER